MNNVIDAHTLVIEAKKVIQEISITEAKNFLKTVDYVIDVREPQEFNLGHLERAINIPRGVLEFKLSGDAEFGKRDKNILIYCKTSGRAALAAESLQKLGYSRVRSMAGGYDAWVEAGNPVTKPKPVDFD